MNYIDGWEQLWRDRFKQSSADYRSQSHYPDLVQEARRRGFRPVTLSEQMDCGRVDTWSWKGGVWVKV